MAESEATQYDNFVKSMEGKSNDEVIEALRRQRGGIDGALNEVFTRMTRAFKPERAGDAKATVQFDITTPDGLRQYALEVDNGTCKLHLGPSPTPPRSTVKIGVVEFFRLLTGKLNPMQAVLTRKLKVGGDMFFVQNAMSWFERPKA